ncbi:MAG: type II toxin-antitoxin system RelE/ParE family toxin [Gemmatimonadaceae bacterium]
MSRPIRQLRVLPEARREIEDAADWYEARSPGLGLEFLRAFDVVCATIGRHPASFRLVHRQTRRALLRRFPYAVFFNVTSDEVLIQAVMHGRRHPKHWRRRAK